MCCIRPELGGVVLSGLEEMIAALIEEGLDPVEAARIAVRSTVKNRTKAVEKSQGHTIERSDGRRPVDYGSETPEQARVRWEEQERNDPQGIYAGGVSAGGVFGGEVVTTETYDPGAVRRTIELQAAVQGMAVQREMLRMMHGMHRELEESRRVRELPPAEPTRSSFKRILGKKRT